MMITGISGFGFFGSKNGRFGTHNCFSKICFPKPIFLWCFGGARVLGQVVKKCFFFFAEQKTQNILTDN